MQDVLGKALGDVVLGCVAIAIFVCILANQTGAMRMMFAMSRDNALPASSALARVNKVTKAPILTAVITAIIAIGILVLNVRQPQIFVVVTSTTVVLALVAYSIVSASFARRRIRGEWQTDRKYFHLGRFGIPVSVAATVWGIAMVVNIAWPRPRSTTLRHRSTGICSGGPSCSAASRSGLDTPTTASYSDGGLASCRSMQPH